jgi:hypothetical protein
MSLQLEFNKEQKKMTDQIEMGKVTQFRHGDDLQDDIKVIVNYLEGILPGKKISKADAIRYAITYKAEEIKKVQR